MVLLKKLIPVTDRFALLARLANVGLDLRALCGDRNVGLGGNRCSHCLRWAEVAQTPPGTGADNAFLLDQQGQPPLQSAACHTCAKCLRKPVHTHAAWKT